MVNVHEDVSNSIVNTQCKDHSFDMMHHYSGTFEINEPKIVFSGMDIEKPELIVMKNKLTSERSGFKE